MVNYALCKTDVLMEWRRVAGLAVVGFSLCSIKVSLLHPISLAHAVIHAKLNVLWPGMVKSLKQGATSFMYYSL